MDAKNNCGYKGPEQRDISNPLSQMDEPSKMFLFSPSHPIQGENSAADPAFLEPGEYQKLQNMRFSNKELRVRDGSLLLTASAPFANAQFRGAWSGYLDGSVQMFAAFRDPSVPCTKVYRVNGITTNVWTYTEITNGSGTAITDETAAEAGTNNGTRFTADGWVSFAVVSDGLGPSPSDILVFSNGVNAPRVFGSNRQFNPSGSTTVATHGYVLQPTAAMCQSRPDVSGYIDLKATASTAAPANTGLVVLTKPVTASTEYYFSFAITGVGTGTITLAGATPAWEFNDISGGFASRADLRLNTSTGAQLILIVEDSLSDPIFNYSSLIANTAGTPVTLYDPANSLFDDPLYYALSDTQYLVAFNLQTAQVSVSMTSLRLSVNVAPPAARTVKFYGIMCGGYTQSTRTHAVTHLDFESRAESGGVVCTKKPGAEFSTRGCAGTLVPYSLPTTTGLYTIHQITYPHTPRSARVSHACLYAKDPGETDYFFATLMLCPRAWYWIDNSFKYDNIKAADRSLTRPAPAFSTRSIPYAKYLLATNGRLFAAGVDTSEVWISFDRAPFRFSNIAPVTGPNAPKNAAYHRIQGELVTGIQDYPGQTYGVAPVNVFTNKKVYRIEGTDSFSLSRLSEIPQSIGSPFPRSITRFMSQIYSVGADRQVWRYGTGDDGPISRYRIDDRLKSATMTNCFATSSEYGFALAVREPGDATQYTMYRYDGLRGQWGSDRFETTGIAGLLNFDTSDGQRRLLIFGDDAKIYWYEKSGEVQDGATYIPINIKTREISLDMWAKLEVAHFGIVATKPTVPPVLTITRNGVINGTSSASQIDFTGATGNRVYRRDSVNDANKSMPGIIDVAATITITGSVSGGMRIQAMLLDVDQYPEEPDA